MSEKRSGEEPRNHVEDLGRRLQLVSVTFDRTSGEIRDRSAFDVPSGHDMPTHITLVLAHRFDEEGLAFRHDARVSVGGHGEGPDGAAAVVEASIIVQFRADSPLEPDDDRALEIGQTLSHRIMYPYLRELVQTTLARLGIAGATLGLLDVPS